MVNNNNVNWIIWLLFSIVFGTLFLIVLATTYSFYPSLQDMRNISKISIQNPHLLSNQTTIIRNQTVNIPSPLKNNTYNNYTVTTQLFYDNQTPFMNGEKALIFSSIALSIIGILLFVSLTRLFKAIEHINEIDKESQDFIHNVIRDSVKKHLRPVDDKPMNDLKDDLERIKKMINNMSTLTPQACKILNDKIDKMAEIIKYRRNQE